jgi:hypothetical protein
MYTIINILVGQSRYSKDIVATHTIIEVAVPVAYKIRVEF